MVGSYPMLAAVFVALVLGRHEAVGHLYTDIYHTAENQMMEDDNITSFSYRKSMSISVLRFNP